jgi:hypothetical protein
LTQPILTPQQILTGQQDRYQLEKLLGAGKYGQVWQAKPDKSASVSVALKVMQPGLTEADQRRFWFEVEILAQLRAAEEKAKFWTDDESRLPLISDTGAAGNDQPAFFVQPLAQGAPLDELLRAQGRLPEADALEIMSQVSRVFQLLHEATGRCYLDFQPKNIFWDDQTRRVVVIDWNLLSEIGSGQETVDLAALATLLYRSVMGLPAPLAGSVRELAQPIERWAAVSRPTQRLLASALHPNPTNRFQTITALVAAIDEAHKVWQDCAEPAFREGLAHYVKQAVAAQTTISDPAQSAEARQTARQRVERAADWLSVAQQDEGFDEAQRYEIEQAGQPLAAWLTGQGALIIGQQFFAVPAYEEASRQFEQAAREAWSDEAALTARHWQAATAAAQQGRYEALQRDLLTAALAGLAAGDLTTAEQALAELPPAETLALLRVELALRRDLPQAAHHAASGEFETAVATVEQLTTQTATLATEEQAILAGVSGDLTALAAQYRAGTAAKKETAALTALFEPNFETGFAELQRKLDAKPGDPDLIAAAQILAGRYPKQARRLADLALDYAPADETRQKLLDEWKQSREELDRKLDERVAEARQAEAAIKERVDQAEAAKTTAEQEAAQAKQRADTAEEEKVKAEQRAERAEAEKTAAEERAKLAEQALQAQRTKDQGQPWREQVRQAEDAAKAAVQAQRAAEQRAKWAETDKVVAEQRAQKAEVDKTQAEQSERSQTNPMERTSSTRADEWSYFTLLAEADQKQRLAVLQKLLNVLSHESGGFPSIIAESRAAQKALNLLSEDPDKLPLSDITWSEIQLTKQTEIYFTFLVKANQSTRRQFLNILIEYLYPNLEKIKQKDIADSALFWLSETSDQTLFPQKFYSYFTLLAENDRTYQSSTLKRLVKEVIHRQVFEVSIDKIPKRGGLLKKSSQSTTSADEELDQIVEKTLQLFSTHVSLNKDNDN